ncbi:DUF5518 domain-containing protein [Saliphagus sp. LR7]|uniref:DUF5518 domain-containing protein n=1 Tax=Saliphagus sp. LR7 TaxID=2282654 RepID=UPI000DF82FF7|nr:DUF5518 domain-containing protein [Saliphagus sp. LR7]
MNTARMLLVDATDERFRTAVLLGLASIPFTVGANWLLTPDSVEATSLLVACVISGYLCGIRGESPVHAGTLTGLVGGAPILVWESATTLVEWWGYPPLTEVAGNSIAAVAAVLAALLSTLIVVVILLVIGWIGGSIGGWASKRIDPPRRLRSGS